MEPSLILGIFGTILGVVNLGYWAWWARREVVKIQNQDIEIEVIDKEGLEPPQVNQMIGIWISTRFELIQTSGYKNCCIRACHLELDNQLCLELEKWFDMPSNGKIERPAGVIRDFPPSEFVEEWMREEFVELTHKPQRFSFCERLERKQNVIDLYSSWTTQTVEEIEAIKSEVEQLKAKYTIGYTRSDYHTFKPKTT